MEKNMRSKLLRLLLLIFIFSSALIGGVGLAAEKSFTDAEIFLPVVAKPLPEPQLTDIWSEDANSIRNTTFIPGEAVEYWIRGYNNVGGNVEVDYTWNQSGPCGSTLVYSDTITLSPGNWSFSHASVAPTCVGTYTNVAEITIESHTSIHMTTFQVMDTSSQIVVGNNVHGFEKCGLPSVTQMEIWWQESPYSVFNIYLGGDHFACNLLIDADWVQAVAQQGWDFILTWAGHGTSCWEAGKENYHPISSSPVEAYQEGRVAAEEAIAAARDLGFLSQKIIYYDVEGYSDVDPTCRLAMDAFLEGWTTRLHEVGDKAGAYGSPCRSYITADWVDHNPLLDDVWFARWSYDEYNQDATVWDSATVSCPLPDNVWAGQQRIRQYAGDHSETYGPCAEDDDTCTINSITSNVIFGEITKLVLNNTTSSQP
jgi:hypothetical protein